MEAGEKCGVAAVYSRNPDFSAAYELYKILMSQFTRGHEGAGLAVHDSKYGKVRVHKGPGKVREVFDGFDFLECTGNSGVGHNRYGTVQTKKKVSIDELIQPLHSPKGLFYGSHNGTISPSTIDVLNTYADHYSSDSEIMFAIIEDEYERSGDWILALARLEAKIDGAYSCALLTQDGYVVAFRDPKGFRPLNIGILREGFAVASETAALEIIGASDIRPIEPGEAVILSEDFYSKRFAESKEHAHCSFEWVYFSRPDSRVEDTTCEEVRFKLGKLLATLYPAKADYVTPIPDSGRSAAQGYAVASRTMLRECFQINREMGRLFITPDRSGRREARDLKYHVIREVVEGRGIVVVDDSIVRGETNEDAVLRLLEAGAKAVHLRISFPPIGFPCFMGVAFSTVEELAINRYGGVVDVQRRFRELGERFGAEVTVEWMNLEGLKRCIGLDDVCAACLNGRYPLKNQPFLDDGRIREMGFVGG